MAKWDADKLDVALKPVVKVKPLEWREYNAQGWSRGLVVGYDPVRGGRETEIKRNPHGWTYGGNHYPAMVGSVEYLNAALNKAKAAAQADYEARILSALEVINPEALVIAALERAARKCAEAFADHMTAAICGEPDNARNREASANMAERLLHEIRAIASDPAAVAQIIEEAKKERG